MSKNHSGYFCYRKKDKKQVDEKQVVFWSEKYAKRAKAECSLVQQNYYSFDYYDEVLKDIGLIMDIDYGKRIRTLGEIKKILAKTKK